MREVTLDTETTGMNRAHNGDPSEGHRIIEIACVEILDGKVTGRHFHAYVNPGIKIDPASTKIHGITQDFLKNKPRFRDIVGPLLEFIGDAEIIIHNAPFDTAFLDKEFSLLPKKLKPKRDYIVTDTLEMARDLFPGEDNKLDSLAGRLKIGLHREVRHNALIDAQILARVYLMMLS